MVWLEPASNGSYDDTYLKYDSLSDDEKTITFVVQKAIKEPSHSQKNLRFKIETEGSFKKKYKSSKRNTS